MKPSLVSAALALFGWGLVGCSSEPTLTRATAPEGFRTDRASVLKLEGYHLEDCSLRTVSLRGEDGVEREVPDVGCVSDRELSAVLPPETPEGTYEVVLTSGAHRSVLNANLRVRYPELGLLTAKPTVAWALYEEVTLRMQDSAKGSFSVATPSVVLLAPRQGEPGRPVEVPLEVLRVRNRELVVRIPDCRAPCTDPIVPGGPYPVRVRDGLGFESQKGTSLSVRAGRPPVITRIEPMELTLAQLSASTVLVVEGQNFTAEDRVSIAQSESVPNSKECALTTTRVSDTRLEARLDSTALADCVPNGVPWWVFVRRPEVTEPGRFAGLTLHGPLAHVSFGRASGDYIGLAAKQAAGVAASDDQGVFYLYGLGGIDLYYNPPFESLAHADVSMMNISSDNQVSGSCARWAGPVVNCSIVSSSRMQETRAGAMAIARNVPGDTSYLYVMGGRDRTGRALRTVERAQVLRTVDTPHIQSLLVRYGDGQLSLAGSFAYTVSARFPADHPLNPGGESLAAPFLRVEAGGGEGGVVLRWSCVPGASGYRVYRGTRQIKELLNNDAPGACTANTSVTFKDRGDEPEIKGGGYPLLRGALGKWVTLPDVHLGVERANAAIRLVGDTLYVAGGECPGGTSTCPTATALASIERASFAPDSAELGAFSAAGSLLQPRARFGLALADAPHAPLSVPEARDAWLLAVGGDVNGVLITEPVVEVARARDESGPLPSLSFFPGAYTLRPRHGWAEIVGDRLVTSGSGADGKGLLEMLAVCTRDDAPAACVPDTFRSSQQQREDTYFNRTPFYDGNHLDAVVQHRGSVFTTGSTTYIHLAPLRFHF